MRLGGILLTLVALVLAGASGFLALKWLEQQRQLARPAPATALAPAKKATIVIASAPLRFGAELSIANIKEIEWSVGAIPPGAFTSKDQLLKAGERRVVLSAIEPNEPIFKWKITGPGQRASLSAVIGAGMKAVTIRVNDVLGVAGFVLPGDRVDVMLTRTQIIDDDTKKKKTFTDMLLQNVRVLGVDQLADDRSEKASVVKAVTLEVATSDAQRLALASAVGTMSLVLRGAGNTEAASTKRIGLEDLSGPIRVARAIPPPKIIRQVVEAKPRLAKAEPPPLPELLKRNFTIGVIRATRRSEYTVPVEAREGS